MRVLVTGATGFLGADLVRRLRMDGMQVRILARTPSRAEALRALGVDVVVGDIADRQAVRAALPGVTVVYHLAGRLFSPGVPEAEYYRTHVEGTRTLLACCAEQPALARFVHCSTTGVLGVTDDAPAGEDAPFAPTNAYERTKAEAELSVRAAQRAHFPTVIVRPGLVYGPGDLHLLGFFRAIQRGLFRPIGNQPVWLHPIYIDDMSEALVRCGQLPRVIGECVHIAGQEPVTIGELARVIAAAVGSPPPRGTIPLAAARALATACDRLPARLQARAPLTSSRLDFLTHSRVYAVEKARTVLGFAAATDLPSGIARTVAWYRACGHLPPAAAGAYTSRAAHG